MSKDKSTGSSSLTEGASGPDAGAGAAPDTDGHGRRTKPCLSAAENKKKKKARGASLEAKLTGTAPATATCLTAPAAVPASSSSSSSRAHGATTSDRCHGACAADAACTARKSAAASQREGANPGSRGGREPSLVSSKLGPQTAAKGRGRPGDRGGNASAGPPVSASEGTSSSSSRAGLRRTKSSEEGGSRANKRDEPWPKQPPSSMPCAMQELAEARGSESTLPSGTAAFISSDCHIAEDVRGPSTAGGCRGQLRKKRSLGTPSSSSHHTPLAAAAASSSSSSSSSEPNAVVGSNPPIRQRMATPSSKIKTGFEVDAPPRHHRPTNAARTGAGPAQPSGRMADRCNNDTDLSSSRHRSLMEGLTDEQRAWAGIEALLMSNDCDSVATRDVLPDAIIRAMAANRSVSTLETACFLDGDGGPQQHKSGRCPDAQVTDHGAGLPRLVDASFSSLKSEATRQTLLTVATAATQNYVLPTALPKQKNALASHRPNRIPSMSAYMSQLCSQQHRQQQPRVPSFHPPQPPEEHDDPTETEESIDLFASVQTAELDPPNGGEHLKHSNETAYKDDEQVVSKAESYYDDEQEDDDGEDDESDDQSRILIQQYTHDRGLSRHQVPDLMNASFSSVRTEMSGIMSLISTAKNYVVQQDDVNPMGVFLGNITRNLERKQEASLVDDDNARVRYMYERDEIADARRQILEEEIERYYQGEYDGWHHDEDRHSAQGRRPDEVSMPSLEPMKPNDDVSPLPSPYSNVTPPFESVRPTPAGDWRAWVDGAFKPGTTSLSPVPFCSRDGEPAPPTNKSSSSSSRAATPRGNKGAKKKPAGSQQRQRSGQNIPDGGESNKRNVRKVKPAKAAPPRAPHKMDASSRPQAASAPNHPDPCFDEYASPEFDEEEVISLSRLRVPVSSCSLLPSDLPRAMPSPSRGTMLGSPGRGNKNKTNAVKRKDRNYDPKASPLVSLRQRMARLYTFGKGVRRGSPASVLEYGCNGGGIATGRGDESRFFPTIEEEDEEDWSNQLLPHHSSG